MFYLLRFSLSILPVWCTKTSMQGYFGKGNLSRSKPKYGSKLDHEELIQLQKYIKKLTEVLAVLFNLWVLDSDEVLKLTLEEAFFLSYAIGCLVVKVRGRFLNLDELWKLFVRNSEQFVFRYIAYHVSILIDFIFTTLLYLIDLIELQHFRMSGWVVKSGIKFGSDFSNWWVTWLLFGS